MPQQTKIFRVFVSSTFTDMKEERRILQQDVFPKLEKFCEEKGAKFQGVDLRWGVTEDSALNQKTLQICFNEISRCQKISPKPNFLILLGDKYGWQPIPEIIPGEEMTSIMSAISEDNKEIIRKWYFLDNNAVPPEYVLQPRTEDLTDYPAWEPVEGEIRRILRDAVDKLSFSASRRIKYFASATHQEIIRGALDPENNSAEHVLAMVRTINGMPHDETAKGFIDIVDHKPDPYSKKQLDNLKSELSEKLGEHCFNYNTNWNKNRLELTEDEKKQFTDQVFTFLKDIIEPQLVTMYDTDEIKLEVDLHREFKERLTRYFKGRDEILSTIDNYLKNAGERRIMTIIGASGSGKSSVMAKAVKHQEDKSAIIISRFIGATSRSSNLMSLLQGLCGQIAKKYGADAKTMARQGDEKAWYDINGLAEILRKCLELATAEKPLLVFLDSLDQLAETDNAKALYWLPRELPGHCRFIVSSLPELESRLNGTVVEHLSVMPEREAREVLNAWFGSIKRKLTESQHQLVIDSFNKVELPIYLRLAYEKSKNWHSYDGEHTLKPDVSGIIKEYFKDLEDSHPEGFVENVVCYLLSGRYQGLAESEILEILAFDPEYWEIFKAESHEDHRQELQDLKDFLEKPKDGQRGYMKIPIVVWSRLYLDLEPFLTERDADGVPIITFFHRQFNNVLGEKYGLTKEETTTGV